MLHVCVKVAGILVCSHCPGTGHGSRTVYLIYIICLDHNGCEGNNECYLATKARKGLAYYDTMGSTFCIAPRTIDKRMKTMPYGHMGQFRNS